MFMDNRSRVLVPETQYQKDDNKLQYKTSSLTIATEYSNFTGIELFIKTQNNIPFSVDPNTRTSNYEEPRPHFEIKITYTIHNNDGVVKTLDLLTSLAQNESLQGSDVDELMDRLRKLFLRDGSRSNKFNFAFVLYKRVLLDELSRDRAVYVREADIVISKDKIAMTLPHPNSSEGLQQFDVTNTKAYQGQAGVFVRVIDNENLAKVRYYYSGKQLITVPSVNDNKRDSGVYCTISTTASDGLITPTTKFFTFEEAEENIGLYRTQEEALSHGDPDLALRAEEARSKAEERRLSRELIEVKHKSEMEANRSKHDLEIIKSENARLKEAIELQKTMRDNTYDAAKKEREETYESRKRYREDYYDDRSSYRKDYYDDRGNRRKDHYEDRSYDRKDTSEMIKYIPALVLGIAGTFAWMKSQQT